MKQRTEQAAAWMYRGLWAVLVRWFRIPSEPPSLPVGPGEHLESFRPAPGYLRYLKFWFWIFLFATDIVFAGLYLIAAAALCSADLWWLSALLLPVALFLIIAPDIVAYIAMHLQYDTTWYVMTSRSMRLRHGLWSIREHTITFENVQSVKVGQGPLQRFFGIADVIVETAGGGASGKPGHAVNTHQGILKGVADAHRLRDLILARMKSSRTTGLGDDDDRITARPSSAASVWTPAHLAALREIREELRATRPV